jgi:hypothetical protein
MQKIKEVEDAKAIMIEAINWSVMKWLREKKRVRKAADIANAALDSTIAKLKVGWDKEFRAAYDQEKANGLKGSPELIAQARKVKQAEEEARKARDDAEKTFDDAEKQLSTTMAREGCKKAIHSWEVHEHVIRLLDGVISAKAKD